MNTTKITRLSLALVAMLLLALAPKLHAVPVLTISQPLWDTAFYDPSGWQSFTVSQSSILTTFGFRINGAPDVGSEPGTMDLYAGVGTGTSLASVVANIVEAGPGPYEGILFFQGNFGGMNLNAGQYTVSYHGTPHWLNLLGARYSSYDGGEFNGASSGNGEGTFDLIFFTPGPASSPAAAVPEPSSFAMLAIGGLVLGGYAWRKKQQTA
ncbi:MAG: PEP-CTERM sorting domain-containing protein [Verrucomicrobiota bacterium]